MTATGEPPVPSAAPAPAPAASPSPPPRPRPVSAADREAFDGLVKDSVSSVRSMASAWRTGLTALITLVTTGIIITGRTATTQLTTPWRIAVTAAVGGGLALALAGLWLALAAEVGARIRLQTLDGIRARYASVQAYLVGQAAGAGRAADRQDLGRSRPRLAGHRRAAHLVGSGRSDVAARLPAGDQPRQHRLRDLAVRRRRRGPAERGLHAPARGDPVQHGFQHGRRGQLSPRDLTARGGRVQLGPGVLGAKCR